MKHKLAMLLAALMITVSISGCGEVKDFGSMLQEPEATAAASTLDYAAAYSAHGHDDTVMTVDGSAVTWGEYYHWVYSLLKTIEQQLGPVADINAVYPYGDGQQTYSDFVKDRAEALCIQYHAFEVNAERSGVALTADDQDALLMQLASDVVSVCGEEGTEEQFFAALSEQFMTREDYDYMNRITMLYDRAFKDMFGENGEELSDAEALSFADANGYLNVKHILFSTTDAEGAAIDDAAKAQKLADAKAVAEKLAAEKDKEARLALFDTLMQENSEDPGLAYYPDGYCFAPGTMHAEFETASDALGELEVSDVVETASGYHIIIRLPMDAEAELISAGTGGSVRYIAAQSAFDTVIGGWINDAEVERATAFESLDLGKLFA